jgi:hypothetical protein
MHSGGEPAARQQCQAPSLAHAACTSAQVQRRRPPALHVQVGAKVGIEETGLLLDITAGRPDVPRILADTLARASALGPRTSIGVFVGGEHPAPPPAPLPWQSVICIGPDTLSGSLSAGV